jgi:hypothetical protein
MKSQAADGCQSVETVSLGVVVLVGSVLSELTSRCCSSKRWLAKKAARYRWRRISARVRY